MGTCLPLWVGSKQLHSVIVIASNGGMDIPSESRARVVHLIWCTNPLCLTLLLPSLPPTHPSHLVHELSTPDLWVMMTLFHLYHRDGQICEDVINGECTPHSQHYCFLFLVAADAERSHKSLHENMKRVLQYSEFCLIWNVPADHFKMPHVR